jgi:pimeloyl-ACP methyl ester carboxylesterase
MTETQNIKESNILKEETLFQHTKFNGTNYIYNKIVTDKNRTIICIHGIGGFCEHFSDFSTYFLNTEQKYNILRYDLIGRGYSDYPNDNKFDADSHIKQLRDLVLYLKLNEEKYIIVAHSMGSCIATIYSNKFPEEVNSLILLSPAGLLGTFYPVEFVKWCPNWMHQVLKMPLKQIQEVGWRMNFTDKWSYKANRQVEKINELYKEVPSVFDASYECLLQFPLFTLEEEVEKLGLNKTFPLLLMWGKKDETIPYDPNFSKWLKYLQKKEDMLSCVLYDDLGHCFFLEKPNKVFLDIEYFLTQSK